MWGLILTVVKAERVGRRYTIWKGYFCLQLNVSWYIDYFIAYNNHKETIVILNTSNSVRYYLQQRGKSTQQTKNIPVVDDEYDINLTLECILNHNGFKVYSMWAQGT